MHLLIRRRQHDDEGWLWTSTIFELEGRLDLDEEEHYLFEKHKLGERVIYNSDAFLQNLYEADRYREAAAKIELDLNDPNKDAPSLIGGLADIVSNSALALTYNILGKISLQLTLQDLLKGFHVESEDLEEILTVDRRTRESVEFVASYLDVACTFDGSEDLSEH